MVAVYPHKRSLRPVAGRPEGPATEQRTVIGLLHPQPIIRAGLVKVVEGLAPADSDVLGFATAEELLHRPGPAFDLVITELNLRHPECSLSRVEHIHKMLPRTQLLTLSPLSERQFGLAALRVGASAFLSSGTSLEELGSAVRSLLTGHGYISTEMAAVVADEAQGRNPRHGFARLSPRELDVIRHLIWGMQLKTIAATLGLNIRTASCYKRNALGKLGMNSIAEVVRYSSEQGLTL